jgi:hypothetical protein
MASILSLLDTAEPAQLTMKARAGTRPLADLNSEIDRMFAGGNYDPLYHDVGRAAILLWHDHFEAAHELAQEVENADGSLLHGIIHRREPDLSNARYWFRRVGNAHHSFECITEKVKTLLAGSNEKLIAKQIMPANKWHPLAFVDVLEQGLHRDDPAADQLLRQIQAAEFYCYLATLPARADSIRANKDLTPPSS